MKYLIMILHTIKVSPEELGLYEEYIPNYKINEAKFKRIIEDPQNESIYENKFALGDIDAKNKKQYNNFKAKNQISSKRVSYISYDKIGKKNVQFVKKELEKIYEEVENGIADGIAIEKNNKIYIVDSGKDEGNIYFGFRKQVTITNNELKLKIVEEINERAISKGYVDNGLFEKIRYAPGNDRGSNIGRELSSELQVDSIQSQNNEGRVSSGNANRGIQGIKFSLSTDGEKIASKLNDGLTDESGITFSITKDIKAEIASLIAEEYAKDNDIPKAEKAAMLADRIYTLGEFYRGDNLVKKTALGKTFKVRNKQRIADTILSTLATRAKADIQISAKPNVKASDIAKNKELRKRGVLSDTAVSIKTAFVDSYAGVERALIRGGINSETAQSI